MKIYRQRLWSGAALVLSLALLVTSSSSSSSVRKRGSYEPHPSNLDARLALQDAKFGLFIHWGVYSVLGDGEWVMNNRKIPIASYEKLPARFEPVEFDPREWVALAKSAGMKYITITSKHHDGFAMFDSTISDWDIVDRTPYKRDVLKMLADECRRQGVSLFVYYSLLDWHHPDYYPRGRTGLDAGRADKGEWYEYLDYVDAQLKELLTNYGKIGGVWFDGWWDRPDAHWRLARTYKLIHDLQPQALVGNNHHRRPFEGEDFQTFEKEWPREGTAALEKRREFGDLPLETSETMNKSWGFNRNDRRYKSTRALVHYLVRAAGHNSNLLLNVGPTPSGRIQPEFVTRLREIGEWLKKYGESIYGTRGGPITPRPWGVTTRKGNKVYVHILDRTAETVTFPRLAERIKAATFLKDGSEAEVAESESGLLVRIPRRVVDEYDTVVVLELTK